MLNKKIQEHCNTIKDIKYLEKDINRVINKITALMKKGGKILFCGNGGSAAQAQHLPCELVVRYKKNRKSYLSRRRWSKIRV